MQETRVQSLGWEDPLEKEMATHSSILAWRIPWTEEPGGLQSMGLPKSRTGLSTQQQQQQQQQDKPWLVSLPVPGAPFTLGASTPEPCPPPPPGPGHQTSQTHTLLPGSAPPGEGVLWEDTKVFAGVFCQQFPLGANHE